MKFCISCGTALVPAAGLPETGTVSPHPASSGTNHLTRVIIGGVILIVVIIAVLYFLQISGTGRILPFPVFSVTPEATPVITSAIEIETPSPEPSVIMTETPLLTATTANTPVPKPSPTKAVVCPSDRHLCGIDCTDIMTDPGNCGNCGVSCNASMSCQMGHCLSACETGEDSCFDGCYNLSYDPKNCGVCGNSCPFGLVCNRSVCSPPVTTAIPTYGG